MKDEQITKESLFYSKAQMMASRNQRFADIEEEVQRLKANISSSILELATKIKTQIDEEDRPDNNE